MTTMNTNEFYKLRYMYHTDSACP